MTTVQFHKGPLYFYYLSYRGNYTLSYNFGNTKDYFGVSHADDLIYFFSFKHLPKLTGKDLDVSQKLIELWTNFATFRHPTPLNPSFTFWEPTTTRGIKYLHISNDGFVIKENLLKKKADFWISLGLKDNLKFNKQKKNQVHTDEL
uniref:Carboxylesterase type B domain-containing protein n=3 Tax=Clastoptera arizonana TaxID=38151 RepID=A0A1B6DLR2_9HEMI